MIEIMRGLLRPYHVTTLGMGPALICLFLPAYLLAYAQSFVYLSNLVSVNWRHASLNYGLLVGTGVCYILWSYARQRQWVSTHTGAGFVLAGYALVQRVYCELLLSWLGEPLGYWIEGGDRWIALVRGSALVALVFGLALVLATSLAEHRLRRQAPDWAFPD